MLRTGTGAGTGTGDTLARMAVLIDSVHSGETGTGPGTGPVPVRFRFGPVGTVTVLRVRVGYRPHTWHLGVAARVDQGVD